MKHLGFAALVILAGAFSRLLPHPPNFTAVAALALVGGAYLDRRYGFALPLVALFLSDLVIGFHDLVLYVYGAFLLVGILGVWVGQKKTITRMTAAALSGSILFFAVTNAGVWISGGGAVYPLSLTGLIECYTAAIPFFRNELAGTLVYSAILFGVFEYARRVHGVFADAPATGEIR